MKDLHPHECTVRGEEGAGLSYKRNKKHWPNLGTPPPLRKHGRGPRSQAKTAVQRPPGA